MTMRFNSQICTTREQSERLLAFGLKKETADMAHVALQRWNGNDYENTDKCEILELDEKLAEYYNRVFSTDDLDTYCPAWSLHRLIEIMPNKIIGCDSTASLIVSNEKVQYYLHDVEYSDYLTSAGCWKSGTIYDNIIDCIGWLIIVGCFNKEYLE